MPSFAALLEPVGLVRREIIHVKVRVLALDLDHPTRPVRVAFCFVLLLSVFSLG